MKKKEWNAFIMHIVACLSDAEEKLKNGEKENERKSEQQGTERRKNSAHTQENQQNEMTFQCGITKMLIK